jgi:HK97 family phage prohead protease
MTDHVMKDYTSVTKAIGDRQIRVIVSTADVDRAGDVVVPEGIDFAAYKNNPVVLFQHDHDEPIARCAEIGVVGGRVEATVQFPDAGVNSKSDEVYGLIKSGVLNAVSIGFIPLERVAMDQKEPWGPFKFMRSEIIEFSVVSIPCNANALIVERSIGKSASLYNLSEMVDLLEDIQWLLMNQKWDAEYDPEGKHFVNEVAAWLNQGQSLFADMAAALPQAKSVWSKPIVKDGGEDEDDMEVIEKCPTCGQPMPATVEDGCGGKKTLSIKQAKNILARLMVHRA